MPIRKSAGARARRTAAAALLTSGVVASLATLPAGQAAATPGDDHGPGKLGRHDRTLVAQAQARGEQRVTVLVATSDDAAGQVRGELTDLGADVVRTQDKVGYVRASLPTDAVQRAADLPQVRAIDLNETVQTPKPKPAPQPGGPVGLQPRSLAPSGPGPDTPDANPYMPTRETGATAFKSNHPKWDGRDVTIGVLDGGVSLDHPALQKTSTGQRKIVDWVTATDPVVDGDPTWLTMDTPAQGPSFSFDDRQWQAPAGSYRISLLRENLLIGDIGKDVNRDGDTTDTFGVLYDPESHDIRVDVNQNLDFTDDEAMRPYAEDHQVNHFGVDNPDTEISEQIPFVVEYREDVDTDPGPGTDTQDVVNIGLSSTAHGSHVAGIAAGNSLFGGEMDGAAPGAKVVSSRACAFGGGCTAVALTEGMMDLVANHGVDVVNMSIGGLGALNDGASARALLYDRLIDRYGVQLFISAGNSGPGINTVGSPGTTTDVVSVGASVSPATWEANYGAEVSKGRKMFSFSSRGPREDGGDTPDITAPGSAISTIPPWLPGEPVEEAGYDLPPGYAMFNGTSMASPQSAGAAALMLSASFDKRVPVTPAQLRQAISTSAKYNPDEPAYVQGAGQIRVGKAWSLLAKNNLTPRDYTVRAPVCTPLSDQLRTEEGGILVPSPNEGSGIYNRCAADNGGHQPGQAKPYKVQITRTSGPDRPVFHQLNWVGNDGTFKARRGVMLPLNKTRTVNVLARPEAGVHGALLRIDDPQTPGVDAQTLNTVVASAAMTAPSFGVANSGTVERTDAKTYFVTVPENAEALQVELSGIATDSRVEFQAINPEGLPVGTSCYTGSPREDCNPVSRHYSKPMPGVWEIAVEASRTTRFLDNPFEVTATTQGVQVDPATTTLDSVPAGEPQDVEWTATNAFGPVVVTPEGGPLGSVNSQRATITDGGQTEFTVTVPEGAQRFEAGIKNPADASADLDLLVFRDGELVDSDADGDSNESVTITDPAAGNYRVVVDGYAVPAGTTKFDYRDAFYSPDLGRVAVQGNAVTLRNGDSATVTGSVTAQQGVAEGRTLTGKMQLLSRDDAVIGTGEVVINGVSG